MGSACQSVGGREPPHNPLLCLALAHLERRGGELLNLCPPPTKPPCCGLWTVFLWLPGSTLLRAGPRWFHPTCLPPTRGSLTLQRLLLPVHRALVETAPLFNLYFWR